MSASRARLVQLLGPAVEEHGYDLEDVTVSPAGKRRVVRVLVDRDGGVTLDDVADVARAISDLLDEAETSEPDLLGGAYVLEVSSPGVDRPLTEPRHWRRNHGRLVKATLADGDQVSGRIGESDELEVTIGERTVLFAEVTKALVQVEFNRGVPDEDLDEIADDEEVDA